MSVSRRIFLKKVGLTGLATASIPSIILANNSALISDQRKTSKNLVFLFQGDSITDGNRTRNNDWNHVMGHGYQYIISSKLWFDRPEEHYMFYNRGISGNRIKDLEARWQKDALDVKPDILSILVGINDVAAIVNNRDPESIDEFERRFNNILEKTKKALPKTKIVLCEPFILPVGMVVEQWKLWETEIKKQQSVIRKLAKKYDAIYVELQEPFNKACKKAPADYWIWDGIHPMPAGHELIARQWLKEVL